MSQTVIAEDEYYDRVYGGWLGKNIGGTLGGPDEGTKEILDLDYYPDLPDDGGPMTNDDLDLQLIWLHALEEYGPRLSATELGTEWVEHIFFPYDEYGFALANMRRGLEPPVAGVFNNPFVDAMGAVIRSEIWAMVAPGAPDVATYYAYHDGVVDHAGGEGLYGEMFFAAIESAIFVEQNPDRLLDIGLQYIPKESNIAGVVRDVRRWHAEERSWMETRNLILDYHGHSNVTQATLNVGFVVLGWLYGEDFGDALLKCVNCGWDTDSTGATLGAILGMIEGKENIPERWIEPIGDRVVVSPEVFGFDAPRDVDELTRRTRTMADEVIAARELPISIEPDTTTTISDAASDRLESWSPQFDPRISWDRSVHSNRYVIPQGVSKSHTVEEGLELCIDFGEAGPAIGASESRDLVFELENHADATWTGTLELAVPSGWSGPEERPATLEGGDSMTWGVTVEADDEVEPSYDLTFELNRRYDGSPWATESISFSLVAATHWEIESPGGETKSVSFPGNNLRIFDALDTTEPGRYRAKTTIRNPRDQTVRLAVQTAFPVKASLNGEPLFENPNESAFRPSLLLQDFLYPEAEKSKKFELPAGEHEFEIEINRPADDVEIHDSVPEPDDIFVLPCKVPEDLDNLVQRPLAFYFLTDVLFVE